VRKSHEATDCFGFGLRVLPAAGCYGLFLMLAEEEKKIRQDPAARVTDPLEKVFGSQSNSP
jgi:Protein of unknown function (DUF4197)